MEKLIKWLLIIVSVSLNNVEDCKILLLLHWYYYCNYIANIIKEVYIYIKLLKNTSVYITQSWKKYKSEKKLAYGDAMEMELTRTSLDDPTKQNMKMQLNIIYTHS